MQELHDYLAQFKSLSPSEAQEIAENIRVQTFKKGSMLLQEGEITRQCFFVLKGCVRQYCLQDGEEKTTGFFTEEQSVVPFSSYVQQLPSKYYFVCAEDCLLMVGDPETEKQMYEKFPKLAAITRALMEQDYGKTQEDFAAFITSSPEQRYLNLLNTRPELLLRVPQHQIASYLGVTPESLSRIRKRLYRD